VPADSHSRTAPERAILCPLRSDLLNADVAVVWLDQDGHRSFGSGRLIASGLVLTAGHVVDCPARDNPISVGWKVRLIHDRPWQGEPRAATVIWRHERPP
jgi:hypothetical protein